MFWSQNDVSSLNHDELGMVEARIIGYYNVDSFKSARNFELWLLKQLANLVLCTFLQRLYPFIKIGFGGRVLYFIDCCLMHKGLSASNQSSIVKEWYRVYQHIDLVAVYFSSWGASELC